MMNRSVVQVILCSLLLVSCASQPADAQSQDEPVFRVTSKNNDDQITVQYKDNTTIIMVVSPSGIGSAKFELASGVMPEKIVARLHLKGLEDFRLISNEVTVAVSISSGEVFNTNNQRIIAPGAETPILSIHPLWMQIETVPNRTKIPLEQGFFEITLPKEFIRKAGNSFEMQWIDFYR